MLTKVARFVDHLLDWQIQEIFNWSRSPEGDRFKITPEGGYAVRFLNKSGAPTVKGEAVQVYTLEDEAMTLANDQYSVQGFWYDDGIADGQYAFVVIHGIAEMLLEDGTASTRGHWVRLSPTVPGRVRAVYDSPGIEAVGSALAYTVGATTAGTLANTANDDATYLQIAETSGAPGFDFNVEFDTDELLNTVFFDGYYTGSKTLQIFPYDYVAAGWDATAIITLSTGLSADEEITYIGLGAQHFDSVNGKMKMRFYTSSSGNPTKRIFIDKFTLTSPSTVEHFKELGHCIMAASAGTDVMSKLNIHLL